MDPITIINPDPKLVELLKAESDGGNGEFEDFVPQQMRNFIEENPNESCFCQLDNDGSVIWEIIQRR